MSSFAFRWAGALLFVISLVYFLFLYLTRFGVPSNVGNTAAAVSWNLILFSAFALHHSVFARERMRSLVARLVPPELERPLYVWIASLLFIVVCAGWKTVPGVAWRADGWLVWPLRLVQLAGLWLTVNSARVLDVWNLAGLRRPEDLRLPRTEGLFRRPEGLRLPADRAGSVDVEFKTTGPYGWVRHPIYAGWFLVVFAASPMTMTRLVFAVASGVYLLVAIPLEERSMLAASRDAYHRYRAQVRWRLVPGVY